MFAKPRRSTAVLCLVVLAVLMAGSLPVHAEVSGKRPHVYDGATIGLAGFRIRLFGIAAPPVDQTCEAHGKLWNCGMQSRWAVADRVGQNWVACQERGLDPDGALIAVCYLGGIGGPELNAWLVARGWALARLDESETYLEQEQAAARAGLGLWQGQSVRPWLWTAPR